MSGFNGINQFGSLTTQNGVRLNFKDFDKDNDGKITQQEFESVLKEQKLDSIELSSVDGNGDKVLTDDEFSSWEQKIQLQEAVNEYEAQISADFAGDFAKYLPDVTSQLKDFLTSFIQNYTGDASNILADFKEQLAKKYQEIKEQIIANDPTTISNNVKSELLDQIYDDLVSGKNGEAIGNDIAQTVLRELETAADNFIKNYSGSNLSQDLSDYLNEYLYKSDSEKLANISNDYLSKADSLNGYIDSNDLKLLKEYVKEFFTKVIETGVTINFGGINIKTPSAITTALVKFTNGEDLKNAMQEVINNLSTGSRFDKAVSDQQNAINQDFLAIPGSSYQVDTNAINYSEIQGYYDGTQYSTKGKDNNLGKIQDQARATLEGEALKSQIKAQIVKMLEASGVPFDKIANVFDNVYADTVNQTLSEITIRKTNSKLLNKNKTYASNQDVKTIVDNFIAKFNANITKTVDDMNASAQDFDLTNIDYSVIGEMVDKTPIVDEASGKDLSELYSTGEVISAKNKGADYYESIADTMIEKLKAQFFAMANAFCNANGVTFDNEFFNTAFDNAKALGLNAGVSGIDAKGFWIFKKPSVSTLDVKTLVNTFTENFTSAYTSWVENEKLKSK